MMQELFNFDTVKAITLSLSFFVKYVKHAGTSVNNYRNSFTLPTTNCHHAHSHVNSIKGMSHVHILWCKKTAPCCLLHNPSCKTNYRHTLTTNCSSLFWFLPQTRTFCQMQWLYRDCKGSATETYYPSIFLMKVKNKLPH